MQTTMTATVDSSKGGAGLRIDYDKDAQEFSVEVPNSMPAVFGHVEAARLIRFLTQCIEWNP